MQSQTKGLEKDTHFHISNGLPFPPCHVLLISGEGGLIHINISVQVVLSVNLHGPKEILEPIILPPFGTIRAEVNPMS